MCRLTAAEFNDNVGRGILKGDADFMGFSVRLTVITYVINADLKLTVTCRISRGHITQHRRFSRHYKLPTFQESSAVGLETI